MSIELTPNAPTPVGDPLSHKEIASLLVKHYDLHEGLYELLVEYVIGMGKVGPDPQIPIPGAMIGMSRLSLAKSTAMAPNVVDAAEINPGKSSKAKSRKKAV